MTVVYKGEKTVIEAYGNGRLDAVSNGLKKVIGNIYTLESYTEHALESTSGSDAATYVEIKDQSGRMEWGVGISRDIIISSIKALVSAVNRLLAPENIK